MNNSNFKILNELQEGKIKFSFLMSRPQSAQRDEAYYECFEVYKDIEYPQILSLPLEKNNRAMYIEEKLLDKVLNYLADKLSTRESFKQHLKDFEELEKKYLKTASIFPTLKKDKRELLSAFNEFYSTMKGLADFAWAPIAVEKILVPKLIAKLKETHTNADEIYQSIAAPIKLNQFQKMRIDICEAFLNKKNSEDVIEELVNKYFWYNEYSYVETLCDENYFKNELAKLTEEKAVEEKERIQNEIAISIKNLNEFKSHIKDEEINLLVDVIVEYTYLRTERVDLLKKLQTPARRMYELIAEILKEETGMNWTRIEVVNLINDEIVSYLSGNSILNFEEIQNRKGFLFYKNLNEEFIITDPDIITNVTKALSSEVVKEIKGSIAFKGIVQGRVSLIYSKEDLGKVEEGSILVARTTMPDYIHAMEKALAFVTEEGGITSHAAIIARELKKPCIVGTGKCMSVLQDGDLVEVDANTGVVRKIS